MFEQNSTFFEAAQISHVVVACFANKNLGRLLDIVASFSSVAVGYKTRWYDERIQL